MGFKKWTYLFILCLISLAITGGGKGRAASFAPAADPQSPPVAFMTAEELKAKLEKGEAVTIIDLRATSTFVDSENKIKGSIHVKLRRLRSRLTLPPLSNVSRNSEVVTYCACPSDETSIRGAQILQDAGFKRAYALKGGWAAWKKSRGQVEARPRG